MLKILFKKYGIHLILISTRNSCRKSYKICFLWLKFLKFNKIFFIKNFWYKKLYIQKYILYIKHSSDQIWLNFLKSFNKGSYSWEFHFWISRTLGYSLNNWKNIFKIQLGYSFSVFFLSLDTTYSSCFYQFLLLNIYFLWRLQKCKNWDRK